MSHYSDSQVIDEINGQGPGDPYIHGHYPGDGGEAECIHCQPKHKTPAVYNIKPLLPDYSDRDTDNDPASAEQAGW